MNHERFLGFSPPTQLPATFRSVKWINENIDNKETTEYIDALISHEIWLHCVLLLIITMHQHDETPQAHIVDKRDPGLYSSSSTGQCVWMFCKGQRDISQAVTPIAKLVPQNRSPLIPRPRHPAAGLRPLPNVCLQPSPLQSTTEAVLSRSARNVERLR